MGGRFVESEESWRTGPVLRSDSAQGVSCADYTVVTEDTHMIGLDVVRLVKVRRRHMAVAREGMLGLCSPNMEVNERADE